VNRFDKENSLPVLGCPSLVLCEGKADVAFIDAILSHHGIRDSFNLGFPNGPHWGKDGISQYLVGLRTKLDRESSAVKNLIIIIDSDNNPAENFQFVVSSIQSANSDLDSDKQYVVPSAIRQSEPGNPSVTIATIPFDAPGCLETLLLNSVTDGSLQQHRCFDSYWSCIGFDRNPVNVRSKQKLSTILSAHNTNNPTCSLRTP